jgi:hypothetical protein
MTIMTPKLVSATYVRDYTIHVRFEDGTQGDVCLADELWGEVFEPLRDVDTFRGFHLDPELNTVTWPSGADLAPEFLYDRASGRESRPSDPRRC